MSNERGNEELLEFTVSCSRLSPAAMLGSPGAGLQNAISTVGPGQPSATAINSAATHIDPSSMQRAYAALGLPYGNQSPAQVQGQGPAQQNPQGPQHQQLRNMNPLGTQQTGPLVFRGSCTSDNNAANLVRRYFPVNPCK